MGRICRKEGFKFGMKERVGDGKLIIIIIGLSIAVSGINDLYKILPLNALHNCHQHNANLSSSPCLFSSGQCEKSCYEQKNARSRLALILF